MSQTPTPRNSPRGAAPAWSTPGEAVHVCWFGPNLRRTLLIALVVGVVLDAINEGDALLHGALTRVVMLRLVLNAVVPFGVSNLGLLAGSRRR